VVKLLTKNIVCFSELTSVAGLHYGGKNTEQMLGFQPGEYPLIMQLFGKEVEFFPDAGRRLEAMGVAGIDINMGCPTTKVVSTECGSALLRNPELAADIVHALSKSVSIPVSVKTRLGYETYDFEKFLKFCTLMQDAGAKLITIHGRTRKQAFSGKSNWEPIYELKKHLKIPVIGNGDIETIDDALTKIKNLDGVMIGRATLGNPWLIAQIAAALRGQPAPQVPQTIWEKLPLIREHVRLAVECHGEKKGIIEMRKHLAAYIHDFPGAREAIVRIMSPGAITEAALGEIFDWIEKMRDPVFQDSFFNRKQAELIQ
jgi:nifR3 family TIM-barrel protein